MNRRALAMACCGVCLNVGLVTLLTALFGHADLSHFARVRFDVPPGAVVEVNGRPVTRALYLNTRYEHTLRVTHDGRVLLDRTNYRPPPGGEDFALRPVVEVAPMPRPK